MREPVQVSVSEFVDLIEVVLPDDGQRDGLTIGLGLAEASPVKAMLILKEIEARYSDDPDAYIRTKLRHDLDQALAHIDVHPNPPSE